MADMFSHTLLWGNLNNAGLTNNEHLPCSLKVVSLGSLAEPDPYAGGEG